MRLGNPPNTSEIKKGWTIRTKLGQVSTPPEYNRQEEALRIMWEYKGSLSGIMQSLENIPRPPQTLLAFYGSRSGSDGRMAGLQHANQFQWK